MAKLATPVSDLFSDPTHAEQILRASDLLEGRDHTQTLEIENQGLFHFELSVVNGWRQEDRIWVEQIVRGRKKLELLSFHISSCCSHPVLEGGMFRVGGEIFTRKTMLRHAAENIGWLKSLTAGGMIKIAVENNNYYPTSAYTHVTAPDFVTQVVRDNKIGFLLDMAHARITAINRALPYEKYLAELPIESTVQIHVSQWGINGSGMAFDAHDVPEQSLEDEVLGMVRKYGVEYVTIEYYRDLQKLVETLNRYRVLLGKETP